LGRDTEDIDGTAFNLIQSISEILEHSSMEVTSYFFAERPDLLNTAQGQVENRFRGREIRERFDKIKRRADGVCASDLFAAVAP
jgi:hypothetical protein